MLRFIWEIVFHLPTCIRFIIKMHKYNKSDKYTYEEKHQCARDVVNVIAKKGRVTVDVFGIENIPKENGFVMYSNHQGKFDGLAIAGSFPNGCAIIVDEKRAKNFMFKQFIKLTGSKTLSQSNYRKAINTFKKVEEEIKNKKKNYLIFPEGGYSNNKNTLIKFNTGCMKFVHRVKCPILPICLYDTYKVYGVNSLKKVKCEVHYLTPILYEEYKDLNKSELADLVKSRIQNKLNEINESKGLAV